VLLGADRHLVAEALARHAPDVPVVVLEGGQDGPEPVMDRAVAAAADLAREGDTVLLAPGCASMDLFPGYAARGEAFADAVRRRGRG
jgi:UDP-N-acetylmuramoylalanine--D-glutamate ligase